MVTGRKYVGIKIFLTLGKLVCGEFGGSEAAGLLNVVVTLLGNVISCQKAQCIRQSCQINICIADIWIHIRRMTIFFMLLKVTSC